MCANKSSCNFAVLVECERYPLYIETSKRCVKYWFKILKLTMSSLVRKSYVMMVNDDINAIVYLVTLSKRCFLLNEFGYVWDQQFVENESLFINDFVTRLKDQFLQKWSSGITRGKQLNCYSGFYENI